MAQKIVQELIDDIDGSEADETITFSWKGYSYEIDLSGKNLAKLDKALTPYVEKARRLGRVGKTTPKSTTLTRVPSNAATVRAWAIANGYEVPERGRIPNDVRDAYEAAND
jgi:hypothetical protein